MSRQVEDCCLGVDRVLLRPRQSNSYAIVSQLLRTSPPGHQDAQRLRLETYAREDEGFFKVSY